MDLVLWQSGQYKLIPVGRRDVEPQWRTFTAPAPRCRRKEPTRDRGAVVAGGGKRIHQFAPNLVAAATDARSQGGDEVAGTTSEFPAHRPHDLSRDPRGGPTPTGVYGCNGPGGCVRNQERHAVGRHHRQHEIGVIGDDGISLRALMARVIPAGTEPRGARCVPSQHEHTVAVRLGRTHEAIRWHAQAIGQGAPAVGIRERQVPGREQVSRDRLERAAAERRSPGFARPAKRIGYGRHVWSSRHGGKWRNGVQDTQRPARTTMTIVGTGIDATDIHRIAESIERYGDRFLHRIFTEGEIAYCRRKRDFASSFAARFAAKEAAMKALGTGHSQGVFWRGIEVVRRHGPPTIVFHGGAALRLAAIGGTRALLTLSHSDDLALAHVLIVRDDGTG